MTTTRSTSQIVRSNAAQLHAVGAWTELPVATRVPTDTARRRVPVDRQLDDLWPQCPPVPPGRRCHHTAAIHSSAGSAIRHLRACSLTEIGVKSDFSIITPA